MSVFIIAEAGVNHNGSVDLAKQLIDVAANSGANAVKFQTFKAENLVAKNTQKAEYQKQTTNASESQFDMLKKLELDMETHKELIAYCQEKDIMFLSTPFDHDSINLLSDLGMQIFKIASGEITNLPYLRHVGSLNKQIVLSTGMSSLKEVESALNVLINSGSLKENITVLHANTMYPTPMEDVNLNAMLTIHKEFDVNVGYSDHTLGIEVDIAAVAMGASCIEKHFTLDKTMDGPDHKASLEPKELKALHFPSYISDGCNPRNSEGVTHGIGAGLVPLAEVEKRQILYTLEKTNNNKSKASRVLGISRQTLREKLRQYEEFAEAEE